MNRRSLFKNLLGSVIALVMSPLAKAFASKQHEASARFGWDAGKAVIFYSSVDRLADAICFSENMKVLFVSPSDAHRLGDSWQLLCEHEKIKAVRSNVLMKSTTKENYFKSKNGTEVKWLRVHPNCDLARQTFGRNDTMICALLRDMDILDQRIKTMRTWYWATSL